MTRVRDPFVFAVSLVLLASAGALGLGLRGDAPALEGLHADDGVRLRGDLVSYSVPHGDAWEPVRAHLGNDTYLLHSDAADMVLVTGPASVAGEDRIVQGTVVYLGPHPSEPAWTLAVVEADAVHAPGLW